MLSHDLAASGPLPPGLESGDMAAVPYRPAGGWDGNDRMNPCRLLSGQSWAQVLGLPLLRLVTAGTLLHLHEPQLPHLHNGGDNGVVKIK